MPSVRMFSIGKRSLLISLFTNSKVVFEHLFGCVDTLLNSMIWCKHDDVYHRADSILLGTFKLDLLKLLPDISLFLFTFLSAAVSSLLSGKND